MGKIPEPTIEQVLAATDIVDVVGSYLRLKRAGSAFKALCPFHQEKTPSFTVNPSRNTFHCFGCGAGGNAIRFVMDYENLPFPEAVRKLAGRAGITIAEADDDPEEEARSKLRRRLVLLHKELAAWYHELLIEHEVGAAARDYLKGRGIGLAAAADWLLGYAPEEQTLLHTWATNHGFTARDLVAAGILSLREDHDPSRGTYARFRHRLMFPVANDYGDIIAFSGRLLDPAAKSAKYMNSPETVLFNKSKTFFGLDRARRPMLKAGRAIVCEGQLDLITCASAGIHNIVAPLGTAFTEQHARLLARFTDEVVLCFDADTAGAKAAERAFAQLARTKAEVKVARMPEGEDPDSLIRNHGADAFREILDEARPFFDHLVDRRMTEIDPTSVKDRVQLAGQLADLLALVSNSIARETAMLNIATRIRVPPDELRDLVRHAARQPRRDGTPDPQDDSGAPHDGPPVTIRNRTLAALCRLALTDEHSHSWLREPAHSAFLRDVPESELLLKVLDADLDLSRPAALTTFLSSLPAREEAFLSHLVEDDSVVVGTTGAEIFFLSLQLDALDRQRQTAKAHGNLAETVRLDREVRALKARISQTGQPA